MSAYDPAADLTQRVELSAERAATQQTIARTDRIACRLYGLTEEEIAVVEGSVISPAFLNTRALLPHIAGSRHSEQIFIYGTGFAFYIYTDSLTRQSKRLTC